MPRSAPPPRAGTLPAGEFPDLLSGGGTPRDARHHGSLHKPRSSPSPPKHSSRASSPPKHKARSPSPPKHSTSAHKRSPTKQKPQVIDLSNEDDDALLSELLDDDAYVMKRQKYPLSPMSVSTAATEDSPPTPGADYYNHRPSYTPQKLPEYVSQEDEVEEDDDEDEDEDDDEEEDASSMVSDDTATLLDRAHDRLHLQDLQDEVQHLKEIIKHKNEELEKLSGQLRRAVATKCDLVLAHNELELHHEQNLRRREEGLMQLKRANLSLVEAQSEVEKDLLNEIFELNHKIKGLEEVHKRDVDEREEMHKHELAMKDQKYLRLQEELRRIRSNGKKQAPVSLKAFLKK